MFIREVCSYFMNFLETDFKRRRVPKRSFALKDKAGNLTGIRLQKYPTFQRNIVVSSLYDQLKADPGFHVELFLYEINPFPIQADNTNHRTCKQL